MSLRYTFRQLFYKKKLRPKRLHQILLDLDKRVGDLESKEEDTSSDNSSSDNTNTDTPSSDTTNTDTPSSDTTNTDTTVTYDVTVNVTGASTYMTTPAAYLIPVTDIYSTFPEETALTEGSVVFSNVEVGDYYVVIDDTTVSDYYAGIKEVTVSDDTTVSFSMGRITFSGTIPGDETEGIMVDITDSTTNVSLGSTDLSAIELAAEDYTFVANSYTYYGTCVAGDTTVVNFS